MQKRVVGCKKEETMQVRVRIPLHGERWCEVLRITKTMIVVQWFDSDRKFRRIDGSAYEKRSRIAAPCYIEKTDLDKVEAELKDAGKTTYRKSLRFDKWAGL